MSIQYHQPVQYDWKECAWCGDIWPCRTEEVRREVLDEVLAGLREYTNECAKIPGHPDTTGLDAACNLVNEMRYENDD